MMTRVAGLCLLAVGLCALGPAAGRTDAVALRRTPGPDARAERVRTLFEAMRRGSYRGHGFPALTWADVPALLAAARGTACLSTFPTNPISSDGPQDCPEGMMALWLLEGVRLGGHFPSLDPLCLPEDPPVRDDREAASAVHHPVVLGAYEAWWQRVRHLPPDRAAAVDPLAGTNLSWR
jgi:hypothetical protein